MRTERMRVITDIKDMPNIAKRIGEIKGVKAVYLFCKNLYVIGELTEKEKIKIHRFATNKLNIFVFDDDLPVYTQFRVLRIGKPLIIKDLEFCNRTYFKILREYDDFRHILKMFIQEGYRLRNGIYVKVK